MENTVTLSLNRYHELLEFENTIRNNLVYIFISGFGKPRVELYTKDDYIKEKALELKLINENLSDELELNKNLKNTLASRDITKSILDIKINRFNKLPWYKRIFRKI